MQKLAVKADVLLIVLVAFLPLFGHFPYRLNIFLSYEGAYRLYLGQMPFRDFGLPMGFMYWVVPALFFKLAGPYLFSLVKAQVFLNIISGLAFRSILISVGVTPAIRWLGVLLFVFSFSFLNYWPWYNHTVIVYELVALAFLCRALLRSSDSFRWFWIVFASLFLNITFFTKQDGGGLTLLIMLALLAYDAWQAKRWSYLVGFTICTFLIGLVFVLPFLPHRFGYWFNYGQPPHTARVSAMDMATDFFGSSQWIKFYFFTTILMALVWLQSLKVFKEDRKTALFFLLTLGILAEAAIFQVTSYVPADNNIFFHSFGFVFLLFMLSRYLPISFQKIPVLVLLSGLIMLWWSQVYWRYTEKIFAKVLGHSGNDVSVVNKNTYLILPKDTTDVPVHLWQPSPIKAFDRMLLPPATVAGMNALMQMPEMKKPGAKVLNMSELTPLAQAIPYALEQSAHYPLWYHQGVGMFQQETDMFCDRIAQSFYDVVIFEHITYLNNFYPFQVRDALQKNYRLVNTFTAPRKPSIQAVVEVYVKKP